MKFLFIVAATAVFATEAAKKTEIPADIQQQYKDFLIYQQGVELELASAKAEAAKAAQEAEVRAETKRKRVGDMLKALQERIAKEVPACLAVVNKEAIGQLKCDEGRSEAKK